MKSEPQFRLFTFTRSAYTSGPGFWIPEDTKKAMDWNGDGLLNAIIFDDSGKRVYDGLLTTVSDGEVYLPHNLEPGETIHVVLFRSQN